MTQKSYMYHEGKDRFTSKTWHKKQKTLTKKHFFAKRLGFLLRHYTPKYKRLRFFPVEVAEIFMLLKSTFRQVLHQTGTCPMMIDNFTTTKNRTIKTVITRNMMKNKTKDWKPLKILITYKHFEVNAFREIRSVGKSLRVFWSLFIGPRIFSKLLKVPIAL